MSRTTRIREESVFTLVHITWIVNHSVFFEWFSDLVEFFTSKIWFSCFVTLPKRNAIVLASLREGRYSSGFSQSYHRKRSRKNQWNTLQIALQRNRYFAKYSLDIDRFMVFPCDIQDNLPRVSFYLYQFAKKATIANGTFNRTRRVLNLPQLFVNDLPTWANSNFPPTTRTFRVFWDGCSARSFGSYFNVFCWAAIKFGGREHYWNLK